MNIVIYEATGDWAAALRRENSPQAIVETRSVDELLHELAKSVAVVAAIEITDRHIESSMTTISRVSRRFPRIAVVALTDRKLSRMEWFIRESGAAHVVFSTRYAREIAAVAQQHLAGRDQNEFNTEESNLANQYLGHLPWGA
ncbi:MAG: hypothetical protein IT427_19765 [Pirellulales bacterium]|nr:hypothetical protein [Pirellulales bacterium]